MKKVLLSFFLIITFSSYTVYKRTNAASETTPVTPPPTSSSSSETSPSDTSASSETITPATQITTEPLPTSFPSSPPQPSPSPSPSPIIASGYKDGSYTGVASDAFYGYIQVRALITGGRLADVVFIRYPNDRPQSVFINQQAIPYLRQEAISAQSATVNIVSGATDSSEAFMQSLGSALSQAKS